MTRRVLAAILALVTGVAVSPATAQQVAGVLGGKATDEARVPYSDYAVQLRDTADGQVVASQPLNAQGLFSFSNVQMDRRLLVELVNLKQKKVVCTEGPYLLSSPSLPSKTDVNIDCGMPPAAAWLLIAGAGAAAAIAVGTRSGSQ